MWRLLNLVAVLGLLGSAVYAYTVKYETDPVRRADPQGQAPDRDEQDAIDRLRAEWALLTRPERLQALAEKRLGLQRLALGPDRPGRPTCPNRPPKVDSIGRKLADLGLAEPTNTPRDRKAPAAPRPRRRTRPDERRRQRRAPAPSRRHRPTRDGPASGASSPT